MRETDQPCSEDGCQNRAAWKGLCSPHYRAERRRQYGKCSMDGCHNLVNSRRLCSAHLRMFYKYGTPEKPPRGPVRRFWVAMQLEVRDRSTGCWEDGGFTMAGLEPYRRPRLSVCIGGKHRGEYLARYVRYLEDGVWPICACHHCDNPKCWNPDHIYAGDYRTNAWDRDTRGRNGWRRRRNRHMAAS